MSMTYSDLQDEVKRRATRDQAGTTYDIATKNIINFSLFRVAREALWRQLRRKDTFDTIKKYTTGSGGGTFTNGSKAVTMVGATLLTDNVQPGRRVTLQGDSTDFVIKTITGETTFTVDKNYDGTTISGTGTYTILPQEEYNLPIQSSHRLFLWHEEYGYPTMLSYIPDQDFFSHSIDNTTTGIPEGYRMWGEDWVKEQVKEGSVIRVSSSASGDTNIDVTVFGIVSSYPDFETITTDSSDGTTAVSGSKTFTHVERVVKGTTSTGRITVDANSANTTVAVLPVGDTTAGIKYSKCQLYPLPNTVFPMNVRYYKDPYRLVSGGDIHELGADFDEAIILLSVSKINYENNKDEGDKFFALYKDEIRSLRKHNVDKIDWFPSLRSASRSSIGKVHPFLDYRQAGSLFGRSSRL